MNQGFLYKRIVFPRYKDVFLRMNTSDDSSHFLSCSSLEFFFPGSILLLPLPSFYSHPSPHPAILHLVGFRGIFVSSTPPPAIFDHEGRFLGVSSLFKPFIQHLMWLTLVEGSLKYRGDCYIRLCVFLTRSSGK